MRTSLIALALFAATPIITVAPAAAQAAATAPQQKQASAFVDGLAEQAFTVLRNKSLSKDQARDQFRTILRENFAVDDIGNRLIRKHRASITPQQLQAYRAALPEFVVNTYSDRLYEFASADVTVVRTAPRGSRGDVDVYTRITTASGGKPIDAIWTVKGGAKPLVSNLTVNGVNVALTQEADFNAYIQQNGFDGLIAFLKKGA